MGRFPINRDRIPRRGIIERKPRPVALSSRNGPGVIMQYDAGNGLLRTGPKQWPIAPNFSEPVNPGVYPYPEYLAPQKGRRLPRLPAPRSNFFQLSGDTPPPPVVVSYESDEKRRDSGLF